MTTPNGNIAAQGLTWTVFGAECLNAVYDLRWMIIFALLLISTDFWWGCREQALKRNRATRADEKEKYKFHFSRAGRRTLNKAVDYLTYLLVGCVAGLAITEPMGIATHTTTAAVGLGFGCLFEISSIVGHIAAVKGINIRLNLKKLIVAIIKHKSEEVAEILDEGIESIDDNRRHHPHKPMQMDDYGMHDDHYHHCGEDAFDYEHAEIPNKDFAENTEETDDGNETDEEL